MLARWSDRVCPARLASREAVLRYRAVLTGHDPRLLVRCQAAACQRSHFVCG
jgi:hypothetical protein